MKKLIAVAIAFLIVISVSAAALTGCAGGNMNKPDELQPAEITEYEGQKL